MSLITPFGELVARLTQEQRVLFYEVLAHNLTVGIRGIWDNHDLSADEMVDQMRLVNEIMHRVLSKIRCERLQTHVWLDSDMEGLVAGYVSENPGIARMVDWAINLSYRLVTRPEEDE